MLDLQTQARLQWDTIDDVMLFSTLLVHNVYSVQVCFGVFMPPSGQKSLNRLQRVDFNFLFNTVV